MIGACYGTTSGSLFKTHTSTLKFARAIPAAHAELWSLSELDWENGTGTCVQWSIGPSW